MKKYLQSLKLFSLLVFVPAFVWFLALSRTVHSWIEYRAFQSLAADASKVNTVKPLIIPRSENLLSNGAVVEMLVEPCMLKEVSIVGYTSKVEEREAGLRLCSAKLTLAGRYSSLLEILDLLCQEEDVKVSGMKFERIRVYGKKDVLQLVVTIQQIEYED